MGNGCVSRSKFRGKNVFRGECNLFITLLLLWRHELKGYVRGGGKQRGRGGKGAADVCEFGSFNWKTLIHPIFVSSL